MLLTTEEQGELREVTAADIDQVLRSDAFGKFAVLSASPDSFIQTACDWQPTPYCEQFLQTHDSDPWILEYHDGSSGKHFRAPGHVTLEQVRRAFQSYLAADQDLLKELRWEERQL